mgnify:CR=1 FL=1
MSAVIQPGKFVELTYKVTDRKTGHVLTRVEFPLGYVHGHNEILAPSVHKALEGKSVGDVIEVPIDGNDAGTIRESVSLLKRAQSRGKAILVVEYLGGDAASRARSEIRSHGFAACIASRALSSTRN